MKNTFIQKLREENNYTITENGGVAYKSTLSAIYDLFAFGGAYRSRSDEDCILLFKNAFEENKTLALKCLFYLRDARGGAGERRFFRVCINWLAKEYPEIAKNFIEEIPFYGRYDDLYCLTETPLEEDMFNFIKNQLKTDLKSLSNSENTGISLLAKWVKSENASSKETKELAKKTREHMNLSHKQYRKMLSYLRTRINILEKLMSENRWDEIEFDKIPSKAGLIYRNAFARNDITAKRYADFIHNKNTKVNAGTLYPYEIVNKVTSKISDFSGLRISATEREALQKYWDNQIDYLDGKKCKMMCVVDTSGSMTWGNGKIQPIDVAISLGMYCAERIGEPFKDYFISFSSEPTLIKIEGVDFVDKVRRIYAQNLCDNTDLAAVFNLLKKLYLDGEVKASDLPDTLVCISDMEIDEGSYWRSSEQTETEMEKIRKDWTSAGLILPKLVFWNVNARRNIVLDKGKGISLVSGCSPVVFKTLMSGKSSIDLMLEILLSDRYAKIEG